MKRVLLYVTLVIATAAVVLELAALRMSRSRMHPAVPDRYSQVPDFTLTNRNGAPVRLADLKGKVWLASFIYTTCPSTCPMLTHRLAEWQADLLACGDGVRLVSFSVDSAHDTPEVLERYAARFKASDRWLFLTGDKGQISRISREGFLLGFEGDPAAAGGITHSTRIALVDRSGTVRRFYDGVGADERAKAVADLKSLLHGDTLPRS